jgi:hypothetical protein
MEPDDSDGLDSQAIQTVQPRELWEKKLDESQRAYDAFSRYRDSERRSLKSVADALNCSVQNVFWWSTRHNWKLRVDAYDLHVDQQQRADFMRSRVRMRDRHLAVAQAMLNVAGHGIRQWQAKIATGAEVNLTPEQLALLVKCSAELERSTLGIDGEHSPTAIHILFGRHAYRDEAGDKAEPEEWMSLEDAEAQQYSQLDEAGRRAWLSWKEAPKKLGAPKPPESDDSQVN